jgi:hypothetical protein
MADLTDIQAAGITKIVGSDTGGAETNPLVINSDGSVLSQITDGTNVLGTGTHPVRIDPTGTTSQPVDLRVASAPVTTLNPVNIAISAIESSASDAFGRLRVSEPYTIFDGKTLYDDQALLFSNKVVSGGTVTFNSNKSCMTLAVSTGASDQAIRQTKRYLPYQPGKGQRVFITYNFNGASANRKKRVGFYDDNNGIFLEHDGTNFNLIKRSNTSGFVVTTTVVRSSWSLNTLSALDVAKANILVIDFQWLGVGIVLVGFVLNGRLTYVHAFDHANIVTEPYMRTPALPVRWELVGTASGLATDMLAICCSIASEGGYQPTGVTRAADRGVTLLATNNTKRPLISLRLKSVSTRATLFPTFLSALASTSANFRWELVLNPTITGGTAASWTAVNDSIAEYDISRTGTVSGGHLIASGYTSARIDSIQTPLTTFLGVAADVDGVRDELILAVQCFSGVSEDFYGSLNWLEVT